MPGHRPLYRSHISLTVTAITVTKVGKVRRGLWFHTSTMSKCSDVFPPRTGACGSEPRAAPAEGSSGPCGGHTQHGHCPSRLTFQTQ